MKRRTFIHLAALTAIMLFPLSGADTVLIPTGSAWKYLDNGTDQGTAWRTASFNDGAWKSGNAQLGYGDGDEATVVGYGPDLNNKYVTTYFRQTFNVTNPAQLTKLTLRALRDDGAVVYLRRRCPPHEHAGRSRWIPDLAPVALRGADETTFQTAALNPSLLLAAANLIAVEIHQANGNQHRHQFRPGPGWRDRAASVTRGPYLQVGTPSSMVIRWRTDVPTDSRLMYGAAPGTLIWLREDAAAATEHQIKLDGLLPDTKYYYSVGTTTQTLAGGDANHYFYTSPLTGTVRPIRIWAISDAQYGGAVAQAVLNAYQTYTGTTRTDVWLTAGDNAYPNGTDSELQSSMFNVFPAILRNTVLWPALGNHDMAGSTNPPATQPYFLSFTMPTNGEAGGVASGTQRYYSYDYGNIHFVCLDSMTSNRGSTGPMLTWLRQDLASTRQRWIIAYWHHSPYSKGTHDSDTSLEMTEMRQAALPILEAANVDLVLSGHSHTYERSFLIRRALRTVHHLYQFDEEGRRQRQNRRHRRVSEVRIERARRRRLYGRGNRQPAGRPFGDLPGHVPVLLIAGRLPGIGCERRSTGRDVPPRHRRYRRLLHHSEGSRIGPANRPVRPDGDARRRRADQSLLDR